MASSSAVAALLVFTCFLLRFCAAQATCKGRCGEQFSRGRVCHCDHGCLLYKECCPDYESACTTGDSCVGRCSESFKRGRPCDCDADCGLYNQCCADFQKQCPATQSELMNIFPPPTQQPEVLPLPAMDAMAATSLDDERQCSPVQAAGPSPSTPHLLYPAAPDGGSTPHVIPIAPATVLLESTGQQSVLAVPGLGQPLTEQPAPSLGKPTPNTPELVISAGKPAGNPSRPSTLVDIAGASASENTESYLANNSSDRNLCDRKPINGVTVLSNGTIFVFRGDFFWMLDINRVPSPAYRITNVWGVPSPIDAVFTRSSCRQKTYIFKGNNCWRFDNGVLDPGYPKAILLEFNGFSSSGKISATLPVPAAKRPESVYFFKKGGHVQKFTFESGTTKSCGKQLPTSAGEKQLAKEAGFSSLVTAAVSVPNADKSDGFDYYIFSKDKYYKIKVVDKWLALASIPHQGSRDNSIQRWLKCPEASR